MEHAVYLNIFEKLSEVYEKENVQMVDSKTIKVKDAETNEICEIKVIPII